MDDKKKVMLVTVFFSLLFLGTSCYLWIDQPKEKLEAGPEIIIKENDESKNIKEETIFVDIKGEVINPGLYELPKNKRVMDVIVAAGGLTKEADTSKINLSKKVTDQMVIIVGKVGEETTSTLPNDARIESSEALVSKGEKSSNSTIVSINSGSKEELMTLSGIGSSKADAIINYRNTHGGFKTIEELLEVKGIGESVFNKIKNYITI